MCSNSMIVKHWQAPHCSTTPLFLILNKVIRALQSWAVHATGSVLLLIHGARFFPRKKKNGEITRSAISMPKPIDKTKSIALKLPVPSEVIAGPGQ